VLSGALGFSPYASSFVWLLFLYDYDARRRRGGADRYLQHFNVCCNSKWSPLGMTWKFHNRHRDPLHTLRMLLAGGRKNHKQKALVWMWPACNTPNNSICSPRVDLACTQLAVTIHHPRRDGVKKGERGTKLKEAVSEGRPLFLPSGPGVSGDGEGRSVDLSVRRPVANSINRRCVFTTPSYRRR
jgi:hypothetical protein